jgi:hypothetical protein
VYSRGHGRKTDRHDAVSIGLAALESAGVMPVASDDATVSLRPPTAQARYGASNPTARSKPSLGAQIPSAVALGQGPDGFGEGNLYAVTFHGDIVTTCTPRSAA